MLPGNIGPDDVKAMESPEFIRWVKSKYPDGPVPPDDQDFDRSAVATTVAEQAEQYRLAQARKLMRLYREWKATTN